MAHSLQLKVVAAGFETLEQLEFLKGHNCDEAQGYYLGRPISAGAFCKILEKENNSQISTDSAHRTNDKGSHLAAFVVCNI